MWTGPLASEITERIFERCTQDIMKESLTSNFPPEKIKSSKLQVFRICVVLAALSGTTWHLHFICKTYFEYGFYESVINKNTKLADFPDVTVCSEPSDHQIAKNPDDFINLVKLSA